MTTDCSTRGGEMSRDTEGFGCSRFSVVGKTCSMDGGAGSSAIGEGACHSEGSGCNELAFIISISCCAGKGGSFGLARSLVGKFSSSRTGEADSERKKNQLMRKEKNPPR